MSSPTLFLTWIIEQQTIRFFNLSLPRTRYTCAAPRGTGNAYPGAKRRDLSLCAAEHGTPPPRISVLEELEREPQFKDQHPSLIPAIKWSLNNGRARPRARCCKKIELELGKYLDQLINQELHPTNITECGNQRLRPLFDEEKCMAITKSTDNEGACLEKK